jgi:hypothetical protein
MEVADIFFAVLTVGLLLWGVSYLRARARTAGAMRDVPAPALGDRDVPIATRLTHYYRLCQRSVRVLERLVDDYTVGPMLSPEDRDRVRRIISDFYEEEGTKE